MPGGWTARVVAVIADKEGCKTKIGSGYLLDGLHVLTAWHCTVFGEGNEPADRLRVIRACDGVEAEVSECEREESQELDVARLTVTNPRWGTEDLPGGPVLFGRLHRDQFGRTDGVTAGFPRWMADPEEGCRGMIEAQGQIGLAEGSERDRAVLRDPTLASDFADNPDWDGFSGGPVFHSKSGRLIGVVIEHHPEQGRTALVFRPISVITDKASKHSSESPNNTEEQRLAQALGTTVLDICDIREDEGDASDNVRVQSSEIESVRACFTEPPGYETAREILRRHHLVVFSADPGGRRVAALHLLGELVHETGISVLDVTKSWKQPGVAALPWRARCGYLLNLNTPGADRPDRAFAEDLAEHAARLAGEGSYLVVLVLPESWRDCGAIAEMYTVELGRPSPEAVLAVHLRRLGVQTMPPVPGCFPPGIRPGQVVALAERVAAGLPLDLAAGWRDAMFLRIIDPEGSELQPISLLGRTEIRVGRPFAGVKPDVPVDDRWVHRDHCRLIRDEDTRRWWLHPRGPNLPLLSRRGTGEPKGVHEPVFLQHEDAILIRVLPREVGEVRHWRLEFTDPQHTSTVDP